MKKTLIVLALASVMVLAFAAPAMAVAVITSHADCGFDSGCHSHVGYTPFTTWHSSNQGFVSGCACHTSGSSLKATSGACPGSPAGDPALHIARGTTS